MSQDQAFSTVLRTIGRGPHLSRPLTREEACVAMGQILDGQVEQVQLGAFLLLLRFRGETAEELSGMIDAARARFSDAPDTAIADLDWPSYADRHRQQPWFLLAALLLAEQGIKVLMHGIAGYAKGYAPTRPALAALGIQPAASLAEAQVQLAQQNIAYVGLEGFCAPLERLFALRPLLGVRSAVNTLSRALNPANAKHQLQGVFHPNYRRLHQDVALLEHQPSAMIFKGGAGEVQRNPLKSCRVAWVTDGEFGETTWPALLPGTPYTWRDEPLDPKHLVALWRGEIEPAAPQAAITGTAALALFSLGQASDIDEAQRMAEGFWQARNRQRIGARATATA